MGQTAFFAVRPARESIIWQSEKGVSPFFPRAFGSSIDPIKTIYETNRCQTPVWWLKINCKFREPEEGNCPRFVLLLFAAPSAPARLNLTH